MSVAHRLTVMRWTIATACVIVLAISTGLWVNASTVTYVPPGGRAILYIGVVVAWGFVGVGAFAWIRRPENRTGALMVLVGTLVAFTGMQYFDQPAPVGDRRPVRHALPVGARPPPDRVSERADRGPPRVRGRRARLRRGRGSDPRPARHPVHRLPGQSLADRRYWRARDTVRRRAGAARPDRARRRRDRLDRTPSRHEPAHPPRPRAGAPARRGDPRARAGDGRGLLGRRRDRRPAADRLLLRVRAAARRVPARARAHAASSAPRPSPA